MCKAEFPQDLIPKPKENLADTDNQSEDHTYAEHPPTRIGQQLASANRIVTCEYFVREGCNSLRQTVVPIYADQTD